jgi:hypothetical protein
MGYTVLITEVSNLHVTTMRTSNSNRNQTALRVPTFIKGKSHNVFYKASSKSTLFQAIHSPIALT